MKLNINAESINLARDLVVRSMYLYFFQQNLLELLLLVAVCG